ncbi:MAG: 3 family transcriptional regulator protein [Bacteroidetes bacterium]|nr:3 family transcriptional regulator protein [Bacteroidota bacterium]
MDIGIAIKTLRKRKKISQKDLAKECNLSVNALCNIENNISFPQKSTISRICEVLNIPTSYLLFFSISDDDIPNDKKAVFDSLNSTIKNLLLDSID